MSLRVLLESVLRHLNGQRIRDKDVEAFVPWQPRAARTAEVPFVIGRVLLQDFTGVRRSSIWRRLARRCLDVERVQASVHAVFVRAAAHAAAKVAEMN